MAAPYRTPIYPQWCLFTISRTSSLPTWRKTLLLQPKWLYPIYLFSKRQPEPRGVEIPCTTPDRRTNSPLPTWVAIGVILPNFYFHLEDPDESHSRVALVNHASNPAAKSSPSRQVFPGSHET